LTFLPPSCIECL